MLSLRDNSAHLANLLKLSLPLLGLSELISLTEEFTDGLAEIGATAAADCEGTSPSTRPLPKRRPALDTNVGDSKRSVAELGYGRLHERGVPDQ